VNNETLNTAAIEAQRFLRAINSLKSAEEGNKASYYTNPKRIRRSSPSVDGLDSGTRRNEETWMTKLPEFIHDLPDEQVQPYTVRKQAEYVAIIQWDGGNDQQHWVLIPNGEVDAFIAKVREAAV